MINATNIFVKYGDRVLLDSVNFVITEKDRVGLVGRNGAGKSTILKIISKMMSPHEGSISIPNNATIGFLHQDMVLPKGKTVIGEAMTAFDRVKELEKRIDEINDELTHRTDYESDAYNNILIELSEATEQFNMLGGMTMQAEAEKILSGLGFKTSDMNRLTDEFSGGWQMRIELTKMLLQRPDYLLLDEPTNHLDIESILWLEQFLQGYEGAVITISHDKTFLDNVTKRTIEIELGKLYDYKANYSKFKVLQAERREKQAAAFKNQQRQIENTEKLIEKFRAKANKAKMAQSLIKQLDKMERIDLDITTNSTMNIRFMPAPRSGEIVVDVNNMVKKYGKLTVLNGVDFQLERSQRIAFVGQNGQGKTTLSKIIAGVEGHTSGKAETGYNVSIGYYAQNQAEAFHKSETVLQTLEAIAPPELRTRVRGILGSFMFSGDDVEKKVSVLSGGERARLAMACLLLKPFNLLILDEPTNHLDIPSKEVLKEALMQYDGALIVVSHDRDFLEGLTDRTLEFRDKKLYNYIGDVKAFLEKRQLDNMREVELRQKKQKAEEAKVIVSNSETTELTYEERKEQQKQQKKLERNVQNIERKIEKLETEVEKWQAKMADASFYNQPDADAQIAKYKKAQADLETVMEEWEEAQMVLEEFLEG